jgi:lipopolysaccharide/colanic/teichoic acid biosynthesis glycosyltransferase
MKKWDELPAEMRTGEVRYYYDILCKKGFSLAMKRLFDIVVSAIMLVILSPVFLILAIAIKVDSPGPVFFRQERVTTYGKRFKIHKFRTMVNNADKKGSQVTVKNDSRITRVGSMIRKCRLDEISQLLDVIIGNMSFVGTRPETVKYVEQYAPVMLATLLLPAGVTSEASILYKDEDKLLDGAENVDEVYVNKVLPGKMYYNLRSIEKFSFWGEIATMFKTAFAVLGKEYQADDEGEKKFTEQLRGRKNEV